MNQVQLFNQDLMSRDGIKKLSDAIVQSLEDGDFNPLDLAVKKPIDRAAMTEAEKYSAKNFTYKGADIQVAENLGVSYDYSGCNHPEYVRVLEEFNAIAKRKKEIEAQLQATKHSFTMVDEETGEVVTVYPPVKSSTSGIKITIK